MAEWWGELDSTERTQLVIAGVFLAAAFLSTIAAVVAAMAQRGGANGS